MTRRTNILVGVTLLATMAMFAILGGLVFAVSDNHARCVAATSEAMPCPGSGMASILFHASFLKTFTDVTLPAAVLAGALLLLVLAYAALRRTSMHLQPAAGVRIPARVPPPLIPSISQFIRWLSLHTNSPGVS